MNKTKLQDDETRGYREMLSGIRFKQSLIQGFTGPTIFGLMAAGGSALLGAAGGGAVWAIAAVCGVALSAVIGLYVVSRLSAEVTSIEHDYQAKRIAKGINGKVPEIEPQKPITFPSHDMSLAAGSAPTPTTLQNAANEDRFNPASPTVSDVSLQEKVVDIATAKARTA